MSTGLPCAPEAPLPGLAGARDRLEQQAEQDLPRPAERPRGRTGHVVVGGEEALGGEPHDAQHTRAGAPPSYEESPDEQHAARPEVRRWRWSLAKPTMTRTKRVGSGGMASIA